MTTAHLGGNRLGYEILVEFVREEVSKVSVLRSAPHAKQVQFSMDICLVAVGVRTAYLVDALAPPDPVSVFTSLLRSLRLKSQVFGDTFLLTVPEHMQIFFAQRTVLLGHTLLNFPSFVRLDKNLTVTPREPDGLRNILLDWSNNITPPEGLSYSLPDGLTQEILVPLAGILLDYPVAYVPVSAQQNIFLPGEPLDVYETAFSSPSADSSPSLGTSEFVFIKFSCPRRVADKDSTLSPACLLRLLEHKFGLRLENIGASVSVRHYTETLDRVAL
ncbi:hypothetical protein F5141DRAFT_1291116 [Pisolithus sp. B1]|nr:hypothetical protein F5141DRAFT_1291116 [Pisolithus sp. B1]